MGIHQVSAKKASGPNKSAVIDGNPGPMTHAKREKEIARRNESKKKEITKQKNKLKEITQPPPQPPRRVPKFTLEEIKEYWDNTLKKGLKDGSFNKLSDEQWKELGKTGEPYLLEMIYRMQEGEDAAYDFFETGPKAFAINNGSTYRRVKIEHGKQIFKKLLRRCSGS